MRTLSLTLLAASALCFFIASANTPAHAVRTTSVQCLNPQIVAERPAGPVTLPAVGRNGYSAWSGRNYKPSPWIADGMSIWCGPGSDRTVCSNLSALRAITGAERVRQ
jgi:hypothetical protein